MSCASHKGRSGLFAPLSDGGADFGCFAKSVPPSSKAERCVTPFIMSVLRAVVGQKVPQSQEPFC